MAITLNTTTEAALDDASPYTFNHTVQLGSNRCLLVTVHMTNGGTANTVTAVTFDGQSLTQAHRQAGSGRMTEIWYLAAPPETASTISISWTGGMGSTDFILGGAINLAGVDQSNPIDNHVGTAGSAGFTYNIAAGVDGVYAIDAIETDNNVESSVSSGNTYLYGAGKSGQYAASSVSYKTGNAGNITLGWSTGAGIAWIVSAVTLKPATILTADQSDFAFGTDDGAEAAHTIAAQNTNATSAVGTKTLRVALNVTGTNGSFVPSLRYQKNGAGGYVAVPTSAIMTNSAADLTTTAITESGNNTASGTWTVTTAGAAQGDLIIVHLAWDDSTNVTGVTAPLGPGSETAQLIGSITADAGTNVRGGLWCYKCLSAWDASATLAFTPSGSEQWTAMVLKVAAGQFDPTTPIGANASVGQGATLTNGAFLPAMSAGATDGGGRLVGFFVGDTNDVDAGTGPWPVKLQRDRGAVGGTLVCRPSVASNSEAIATTSGYTLPATAGSVAFVYIIRPPTATTNQVYISGSGNVADSGETTTARLTPPTGKTTTAFSPGRRWDDENGLDTVTVSAADGYTEVEHILTTQSPAADGDYFDFRYYMDGGPLTGYTVTPRWVIGAGGSASAAAVSTWFDRSYPRGAARGVMRGVA